MDAFLAFISSAQIFLLVAGVILIAAGLIAPRRFFSIEVDWTAARSLASIIVGVVFLALSYYPPTNMDAIRRNVQNGRNSAYGASTNTSDNAGCVAAAKTAYQQLDEALRLIDGPTQKKS